MIPPVRLDKSAFSVVLLHEQEEQERHYWLDKTPHERLEALEQTRRLLYGHAAATARLQRVLEVARRA
jgi:hypothetical protein